MRKVLFDDPVDPDVAIFVAKSVEVFRPGKRDVAVGTAGVEGCVAIDILNVEYRVGILVMALKDRP